MSSGYDILNAKNKQLREALTQAQRTVAELRGRLRERELIVSELHALRIEMKALRHPPAEQAAA